MIDGSVEEVNASISRGKPGTAAERIYGCGRWARRELRSRG